MSDSLDAGIQNRVSQFDPQVLKGFYDSALDDAVLAFKNKYEELYGGKFKSADLGTGDFYSGKKSFDEFIVSAKERADYTEIWQTGFAFNQKLWPRDVFWKTPAKSLNNWLGEFFFSKLAEDLKSLNISELIHLNENGYYLLKQKERKSPDFCYSELGQNLLLWTQSWISDEFFEIEKGKEKIRQKFLKSPESDSKNGKKEVPEFQENHIAKAISEYHSMRAKRVKQFDKKIEKHKKAKASRKADELLELVMLPTKKYLIPKLLESEKSLESYFKTGQSTFKDKKWHRVLAHKIWHEDYESFKELCFKVSNEIVTLLGNNPSELISAAMQNVFQKNLSETALPYLTSVRTTLDVLVSKSKSAEDHYAPNRIYQMALINPPDYSFLLLNHLVSEKLPEFCKPKQSYQLDLEEISDHNSHILVLHPLGKKALKGFGEKTGQSLDFALGVFAGKYDPEYGFFYTRDMDRDLDTSQPQYISLDEVKQITGWLKNKGESYNIKVNVIEGEKLSLK